MVSLIVSWLKKNAVKIGLGLGSILTVLIVGKKLDQGSAAKADTKTEEVVQARTLAEGQTQGQVDALATQTQQVQTQIAQVQNSAPSQQQVLSDLTDINEGTNNND